MDNWDEIRTALQVAKMGTVSGAADAMGVHHATVIRHIDALEKRLGAKLFQRHSRGYTATEAGRDLLTVAQTTEEQFAQLSSRIKGQGDEVAGELVITSLIELSPLLAPVLAEFQVLHPNLLIRYLTGGRLFRLEHGEAHVAIRAMRAGGRADQPDNVVQPLARMGMRMMAAPAYIARHGMPVNDADLAQHRFISLDESDPKKPFNQWLNEAFPHANIVLRVEETGAMIDLILAGAAIGFYPSTLMANAPEMIEVTPQRPHWQSDIHLVTHVDLHRTTKVQAFLAFLKIHAKSWPLA